MSEAHNSVEEAIAAVARGEMVVVVDDEGIGVDTPEDVARVEAILAGSG